MQLFTFTRSKTRDNKHEQPLFQAVWFGLKKIVISVILQILLLFNTHLLLAS